MDSLYRKAGLKLVRLTCFDNNLKIKLRTLLGALCKVNDRK
jgi:hypothetical protein